MLDEVAGLLESDWPDFAKVIRTGQPEVADAAALFVRRLVHLAEDHVSARPPGVWGIDAPTQAVFEQIGRMHWMSGRDLPELMAAYQVGARAAWRHVFQTAVALNVEPEMLTELGEAVFEFVHELSASSANGYVHEESESTTARERLRADLARLLLSDRSQHAEIQLAARRACWSLPGWAVIVVVDPANEGARVAIDRLGPQTLPIRTAQMYGVILPVTAQTPFRRRLSRAMRGSQAVVGGAVTLDELPATVSPARTALALRRRGVLTDDPLFVSDHLDTLLIHRDERLYGKLRSEVLAPLEAVPGPTRQRLLETLTAWLSYMGDRHQIAEDLHIHPQTVRYRMGQLRDLLGDDLDDPAFRAKLFLTLIWSDRV